MGERTRAGVAGLGDPAAGLSRGAARSLLRRRSQARAVLWAERLGPAVLPAALLAVAYACVALLGVTLMLPAWLRLGLAVLVGLGCAGLLWRGLWRVTAPAAEAADRRIEQASGLRHRPLAVLADRPAVAADPAMAALWRAHAARAAAQLKRLRVGAPRPVLAARDPQALRGLLVVALVAALVVAGPDAGSRLGLALMPGVPAGPPAPAPVLQAWITPPTYTGEAPTFLHPEGGDVSVPRGSRLVVSLTGGSGTPVLALDATRQPFLRLGEAGAGTGSWQAEQVLDRGGRLVVQRHGAAVAGWNLTVVADAAPVVAWSSPPGPLAGTLRTRLPWQVSHRYGVTALAAELRLQERPDAAPAVVPIPLPGAARTAHGVATPDLVASPWAGLPVTAVLVGRDAQGQAGRSEVQRFVLPERIFHNPLARALIGVRRRLALDPGRRDAAVGDLQALASTPEAFGGRSSVFLNLSDTASLLAENPASAALVEAQDRLWAMALALDGTELDRTAQAVADAREAVQRQLDIMREQAARDQAGRDQATPRDPRQGQEQARELDHRVQALRDAIARHMRAFAERLQREGALVPRDTQAQQLGQRDIDRLLQQAEQAARQGRPEEAQQRLAQLQRLLEQLQDAEAMSPEQARQAAENARRGHDQMSAVRDMVKREGTLLDHAQAASPPAIASMPPAPSRPVPPLGLPPGLLPPGLMPPGLVPPDLLQDGQDQAQDSSPPDGLAPTPPLTAQRRDAPGAQATADARSQRALRRALGELMQQFGDLAGKVPPSLGEADQAMQEAASALAAGGDPRGAEQRALEALQKGGQQMGQQMARQFSLSSRPGQGSPGQGQPGEGQALGQDGQSPGDGQDGGDGQDAQDDGGTGLGSGQEGPERGRHRDPLGRLTEDGGHGMGTGGGVRIPDGMEQARARAIQDELRRRGADRSRPQEELDYIGRLLRPF